MKRCLLMALLCAALAASALEFPVRRLNTYPRDFKECYQGTTFRNDKGGARTPVLYGYLKFPAGTSAVQVSLTYRSTEATALSFGMTFQKEKGGNESAGRGPKHPLPCHPKAATETLTYEVPANAVNGQFSIAIAGKPSELEVVSLRYELISDRAALPKRTVSGAPSTWNGAAELRHFYVAAGGGAAQTQTRVRLAYDDQNLYVGYICDEPAMKFLKADVKTRDGRLWEDDDVELFLFDASLNYGWQFIVNSVNAQFDAVLRQAQEGDPYKADKSWNGEWRSAVFRGEAAWEAALTIPWKTLGYKGVPEGLSMNFSRERVGGKETSHWNAYAGNLNDCPKFALASFGPKGEIVRYRKEETSSYLPKRAKPAGLELLSDEPGGYLTCPGSHGFFQNSYPAAMQAAFTPARQREYLETAARAGNFGPKLPWAAMRRNIPAGVQELQRLHREFGMQFAFAIYNSSLYYDAIKDYHAQLYCGRRSDPASPEYLATILNYIEKSVKPFVKAPGQRELVGYIEGVDEPTNHLPLIYNRKGNPDRAAALDRFDAAVKAETGFGKYGFQDFGATAQDADAPFRRIAFWRYWNRRFADYLKATTAAIRALDPTLLYEGFNRNTCSGICCLDLAALTAESPMVGCDPYPTSAKSFFGMSRAIYHTGFSVKMVHDLAPRSVTRVYLQGFIYHGGRPTPADLREWAAQALKNGARVVSWYASGPASLTMPDGYAEILRLSTQIRAMRKLPLPQATRSAVLYSDYDRWGLDDKPGHAVYTVYALLGEHVKANFRFVSPTGLANGVHSLDGISVLYLPRMRFTDPETTRRILDFVRGGGTLVVFDPTVWSWNLDGTPVPERALLTGRLAPRAALSTPLSYGKARLPVAATAHIAGENGKIAAFDFADAEKNVVARYPDGKPAAVTRPLGKGKVLCFAVQPFGCSDAALAPDGWTAFFQTLCKAVGEPTGLRIWDFELPAAK